MPTTAGRPVEYAVDPIVDPLVDLDQNLVVDRPVVELGWMLAV